MNWKLTLGKLHDAWLAYPSERSAIRRFPEGRPIFLTGTHRSGTTWAAGMLAEPGLWYVHEPFNPNKGVWKQEFTYASPAEDRPDIDAYVRGLLRGQHRRTSNNLNTDHALMPMRLFRPPVSRVLIKDPLACLLTGYLARRFDFQTVVLFRHPAGFAASVTRLGWPVGKFLRDFLERVDLMDAHLSPFAGLMQRYSNRDDLEAATVLHGVLNTVLWGEAQQNAKIRIFLFEDLCREPLGSFRNIFEALGLPYSHITKQRHQNLCFAKSVSNSTRHPHAIKGSSSDMASSWRDQLSIGDISRIRKIWTQFSIPFYRDETYWNIV